MANSNWTPNQKQKLFLKILGEADGALTLAEISAIAGEKISSGTINCLKEKGFFETENVVYECNVVRKDNGVVVGTCKKSVKGYKLVKAN